MWLKPLLWPFVQKLAAQNKLALQIKRGPILNGSAKNPFFTPPFKNLGLA